jgi:hypothetical protein
MSSVKADKTDRTVNKPFGLLTQIMGYLIETNHLKAIY